MVSAERFTLAHFNCTLPWSKSVATSAHFGEIYSIVQRYSVQDIYRANEGFCSARCAYPPMRDTIQVDSCLKNLDRGHVLHHDIILMTFVILNTFCRLKQRRQPCWIREIARSAIAADVHHMHVIIFSRRVGRFPRLRITFRPNELNTVFQLVEMMQ